MLDPPRHPFSPLLPRRPPSPTLISLYTGTEVPSLLDAQDELDFLAIDEKAKRNSEERKRRLGPRLKPKLPPPGLLVDLDELEKVQQPDEVSQRKHQTVHPLRGGAGRDYQRTNKAPSTRVGPLVDVDFNESLKLAAPSYWKPRPKDTPVPSYPSSTARRPRRITTPSAVPPKRSRQPQVQPRAATSPPPRQPAVSNPFIVSPTPLRALPLQLRATAPIFKPLKSPPPRLATPGLPVAASGNAEDIYIDSPTTVSKLFKANLKWHFFPPIPKIFWGRSEDQARLERERAARAGSDSEDDFDSVESRSETGRKRDDYRGEYDQLNEQTPTKRQKGDRPLQGGYRYREAKYDPTSHPYRPSVSISTEPHIDQQDTAPRRPPITPALVDISPPGAYLGSVVDAVCLDRALDEDMDFADIGDQYNAVSAFGPFEGMMKLSAYRWLLSTPSARTNIPPSIVDKARHRPLDRTILAAWKKTEPTSVARQQVGRLLSHLERCINKRLNPAGTSQGRPRFEVDVFGSVSWGGETGQSGDLDLVIIDHDMPYGYEPGLWEMDSNSPPSRTPSRARTTRMPIRGLPPVYNLRKLADVLRSAGMVNPFGIHATTPIVKFSTPLAMGQQSLECDINVNDLGGWYNSSLILHYCLISPFVLRPLIYTLKRWAAAFGLNDGSGAKGPATMSSYCLTLMAIAYLQHRGVLPNLQASVDAKTPKDPSIKKDLVWVAWSRDQGVAAHIGFDTAPPPGWRSREPDMTVGEAVRGFFSFFAESGGTAPGGRMDWDTQMISILQGGVVSRKAKFGTLAEAKETQMRRIQEESRRFGGGLPTDGKAALPEDKMGKCDEIQPLKWVESPMVVQDPFLWQKNCAVGMSKKGKIKFHKQLDIGHRLLTARFDATLDNLVYNPEPPVPRSPSMMPRGGGRARGRGRRGSRGRGSPSPSLSVETRLGRARIQP